MLTLGKKTLSVPILQGGMGVGVSLGGLAGAVAACGGMGCISTADAGYREPDFARDPASANHRALTAEIRKAKQIANGAGMVAINAMVATQDYAAAIRTAVEAGVDDPMMAFVPGAQYGTGGELRDVRMMRANVDEIVRRSAAGTAQPCEHDGGRHRAHRFQRAGGKAHPAPLGQGVRPHRRFCGH